MANSTDLKFFTNSSEDSLYSRFVRILKNCDFFDCLVGYFRSSGFVRLYPSFEGVEKIRILVGMNLDKTTAKAAIEGKKQSEFDFCSNVESKEIFAKNLQQEVIDEEDDFALEKSVSAMIELIKNNRLEIRIHPSQNIHAKLYIIRFAENDRDHGRVITGSSNFSENGFVAQREFNVELKDKQEVEFALGCFEKLWAESVEVSQDYIATITTKTWLNNQITPYEIYLKFLYEYFKEDFQNHENEFGSYPKNFRQLQYQQDAVNSAFRIVNSHGGVFLSDVVGLGKTYMGTMLCKRLIENGARRVLTIAPPHLIDENNQGSWHNAFNEFHFLSKQFKCYSIGVLDEILNKEKPENYDIVLIDESHRFRSELTENYPKLEQICRGKKVILVSATPYNNKPSDLLTQIKLFQSENHSTIPHCKNLKNFFNELNSKIKDLDRQKDHEKFIEITKLNAKKIRQRILKHLMVRRTRTEINKIYGEDLTKQQIRFPEVVPPQPIFYEFNEQEDSAFVQTLDLIKNKLVYIRYTPLSVLKNPLPKKEQTRLENMEGFMRTLLFKRLESSIFAFKNTVNRFIKSYENFIKTYESGRVFVSKKHSQKIFDFLESGDDEAIEMLIKQGDAEEIKAEEFTEELGKKLRSDLEILKRIAAMWNGINRDPKIIAFKEKLSTEEAFNSGKSIIFTESKETAKYLEENLREFFGGRIIAFSGSDDSKKREIVLENFDANSKNPCDDFDILITTDVLAEGANLHRANIVVNYDLPWNPAKMMQRVGRINRVDSKHSKIFTYNFFPTKQSNDVLKLEEAAKSKIASFITLLGNDAKLLTEDEEIASHQLDGNLLYKKIMNPQSDEESEGLQELEYLEEIKKIQKENPQLFEKIQRLPKKSRSSRSQEDEPSKLVSFLKKGRIEKFYLVDESKNSKPQELDFLETAELLKASPDLPKGEFDENYAKFLKINRDFFKSDLKQEEDSKDKSLGRDPYKKLLKFLNDRNFKNFENFSNQEDEFIRKVIKATEERRITKKTCQKLNKKIEDNVGLVKNPLKLLQLLKEMVGERELEKHFSQEKQQEDESIEVILSCYFRESLIKN